MDELKFETVWFEQRKYEEAESRCHQKACCASTPSSSANSEAQASQQSSIVAQIAKARETIQQTLKGETSQRSEPSDPNDGKRLELLEKEAQQLKEVIKNIQQSLSKLEEKVANIEISKGGQTPAVTAAPPAVPASAQPETKPSTKPESDDDDDDDDDDEDLFGSDDDEEAEKLKEIRLAQYAAKKAKKPAVIAKSNIILDVKPWDDETDMAIVEEKVRTVTRDGLLWGKSKLVPVGYGIKKLQIGCVVEDDKVGVDFLEEEITKFEDLVQSVDVAAFNKV